VIPTGFLLAVDGLGFELSCSLLPSAFGYPAPLRFLPLSDYAEALPRPKDPGFIMPTTCFFILLSTSSYSS
jgi:hypothetical protein